MLVTVRHIQSTREMNSVTSDEGRYEIAQEALRNNQYIRVAEFEADADEDVLNIAYEITNSITEPWYLSRVINVSEHAKNGCRSTSMGDIIQVNGTSYIVESIGFRKITKE